MAGDRIVKISPLSLADACCKHVDQVEALRMLGQHGRKYAGDNASELTWSRTTPGRCLSRPTRAKSQGNTPLSGSGQRNESESRGRSLRSRPAIGYWQPSFNGFRFR